MQRFIFKMHAEVQPENTLIVTVQHEKKTQSDRFLFHVNSKSSCASTISQLTQIKVAVPLGLIVLVGQSHW